VQNVPESAIVAAGCVWAARLAAIGLANLIIALHFDFMTWAWFISVGAVGAKLVVFALPYGAFGTVIRKRIAPSAA
jgi:intracellular septation protein A